MALNKESVIELDETQVHSPVDRDEVTLARLGKKPVLKRSFGFLAILGFSCTSLVTWEGSLTLFLLGLQNGGPAGVIYGYIVVWIGTTSLFIVLSELVSMAPTSGGQYHWVSMLAPQSSQKVLSYVAGWLTVTGWQAFLASGAFLTATMIQGLVILTHPEYVPPTNNWHGTFIYWGLIAFCVIVNTGATWLLPKFEGVILVIHVLGFFGVLIPLITLGPHASASDVFNTWVNTGGWQNQGLSFCVGLMGNVFAFIGGDGAVHMSEEIQNAAVVVPRSIMTGIMLNGALGFGMVLTVLFRAGDIDLAIQSNPLYPFMAIFYNAVSSVRGAAVMASLVMILAACATVSGLASASRVLWAFSRDRGVPGWRGISRVSPRTSIPVHSVATTTVIAIVLSLVNIGSATAFNGVISISIAGLFASYLLVAVLLLWRRCTGGILTANSSPSELTNTVGTSLTWGPWRVPGMLGIINNAFACAYMVFVFFFSFWPSFKEVTPQTMNWSILVTGFVTIVSTVYYVVWGRKTYKGPVIEI